MERFTFINSILSKSKKLISYYPSLLVASVLRQPQAHSKEQQCFHQSDKGNRRIRLGAHGYCWFQNNHKRMHQQKRQPPNLPRAIPLRKPATPIPSGTHIFSKREEISSINDSTGMDVRKRVSGKAYQRTHLKRSVRQVRHSDLYKCQVLQHDCNQNMTVRIRNLHRYMAGTLTGSIYIFFTALPLNSML